MFLKRQKRRKQGIEYEYWELVRTVRTASGPRHETVAYLGKLEESEARQHYGWTDIDALLEGREPDVQLHLDLPGIPAAPEPEWRRINVRGVRVERVRAFGRVWTALSVWRRLGLHRLLREAARGYSRDNRPDCKQVCIGLVVTHEGLPVGYEVFAGNRNDVTTLEEIVTLMEEKYGKANRVWVTDRGIVSEENLEFLRERNARYLVGTPKSLLRRHEAELLDAAGWQVIREGLEVKLVAAPDGQPERFVLCRSRERAAKERAMLERQIVRLRKALDKIDAGLRKRPSSNALMVERRIGRWLGRNPAAERVFEVEVLRDDANRACGLQITEQADRLDWASLAQGAYLLRTNHVSEDPTELWKWYIQLTQAESAFRTSKSDLMLRPVFHHKEERVDAHILVCFLALAMWRTLEQWMASKGLGTCARQFLLEMDNVHSLDVLLPTDAGTNIHLRTVSKPEKPLAVLLAKLGLNIPQTPKQLENVV